MNCSVPSVTCNRTINYSFPLFMVSFLSSRTSNIVFYMYRVSQKKYPLLTGNRNETIRHYNTWSEQLNLSIFNLDPHTLHLKIVCQKPEIQACKVKIYSAPETRGLVKGPSPDLISQPCCKRIRTLTCSLFF